MAHESAQTVMLTTQCSAGCSHCPFSDPKLEKLHLPLSVAKRMMGNPEFGLTVVSGGEPFEHPGIGELLSELVSHSFPFRIATGGFVDLDPWSTRLAELSHCNPNFEGLSMGTDVLTGRCPNPALSKVWTENLRLLNRLHIPYSITITLGQELEPKLLDDLTAQGCRPEFIYLRHSNDTALAAWRARIEECFPGMRVIDESLGTRAA